MSEALPNFEGLLREALTPVEPPEDLIVRLEDTLTSITELAADTNAPVPITISRSHILHPHT